MGFQIRSCWLNFGPQHPAAHGIVRLNMQLCGEVLCRVDPQFGLLHRGTEKLVETRTVMQALPYFDRFDYVANLFQEHAYCLAVESLGKGVSVQNAQITVARLFFDELSRVLNHLLTLSATSLDLSAMGPIFWAFEERERIMELFERVSGARMHTALYAPFSFDFAALTARFWSDCAGFLNRAGRALSGAFLGLLHNRALKSRLGGVGQLSPIKLKSYGITGVVARSSGLLVDLRLHRTRAYSAYPALSFRTFVGRRGDNYDRFILRIKEVMEALRLVAQVVSILRPTRFFLEISSALGIRFIRFRLPRCGRRLSLRVVWKLGCLSVLGVHLGANFFRAPAVLAEAAMLPCRTLDNNCSVGEVPVRGIFVGMEELIASFCQISRGFLLLPGFTYAAVETPKGELGVTLLADGGPRPYRMKLRTPVAHNLHLIPGLGSGVFFADFVASFCSLDVVFGEIDR
jgi:NADH:ubiquinone oxidoreductase subunit D